MDISQLNHSSPSSLTPGWETWQAMCVCLFIQSSMAAQCYPDTLPSLISQLASLPQLSTWVLCSLTSLKWWRRDRKLDQLMTIKHLTSFLQRLGEVRSQKKTTISFGNFSQHGGGAFPNPKTFVNLPSIFLYAKFILRC